MLVDVLEALYDKQEHVVSDFVLNGGQHLQEICPAIEQVGVPDVFVVIVDLFLNRDEGRHDPVNWQFNVFSIHTEGERTNGRKDDALTLKGLSVILVNDGLHLGQQMIDYLGTVAVEMSSSKALGQVSVTEANIFMELTVLLNTMKWSVWRLSPRFLRMGAARLTTWSCLALIR